MRMKYAHDLFMWLGSTFQHEWCNATGNPYTDLFPNDNNTLEVDIYKGVCVFTKCVYVWSHSSCESFVIDVWICFSLRVCVPPGSGPGLFLWPCSSLHLGHWHPGSRTELHYDRNLLRPVCYGGINAWLFPEKLNQCGLPINLHYSRRASWTCTGPVLLESCWPVPSPSSPHCWWPFFRTWNVSRGWTTSSTFFRACRSD